MQYRFLVAFVGLLFLVPSFVLADGDIYPPPKTPPEFWRAARYEMRVGNFNRAKEHIEKLYDQAKADDDALYKLVTEKTDDKDVPGLVNFLRLRLVPKWSDNPDPEKARAADIKFKKETLEPLIEAISGSYSKILKDPIRIAKFARNLAETPEERDFAFNELRKSGDAVVPVFLDLLRTEPGEPERVRVAILDVISKLDSVIVAPLLTGIGPEAPNDDPTKLSNIEASLKAQILTALAKRTDFDRLTRDARTDPYPLLYYYLGRPDTFAELSGTAKTLLLKLGKDPERETDAELKTPQGKLTQVAQTFVDGKGTFPDLGKNLVVYQWNSKDKSITKTEMTVANANRFYAYRYARLALSLQPDNRKPQRIILGLTANETGRQNSLRNVLLSADYALLTELADDAIKFKNTALMLALVNALAERGETKAGQPGIKPKPDPKVVTTPVAGPALLVKALDYPDQRVQFAAALALASIPGEPTHGRTEQVVKIFASVLAADPLPDAKPKAIIGDKDAIRVDQIANLLRRINPNDLARKTAKVVDGKEVEGEFDIDFLDERAKFLPENGYDVEVYKTGRDLFRRLRDKADISLLVIDRHILDPQLNDMLAQLNADRYAKGIPLLVIASGDGPPVLHPFMTFARYAVTKAYVDKDLLDIINAENKFDAADRQAKWVPQQVQRLAVGLQKHGFPTDDSMLIVLEYLAILSIPETRTSEVLIEGKPVKVGVPVRVAELASRLKFLEGKIFRGSTTAVATRAAIIDSPLYSDPATKETREKLQKVFTEIASIEGEFILEKATAIQDNWDQVQARISQKGQLEFPGEPDIVANVRKVASSYPRVGVAPQPFIRYQLGNSLISILDDSKTPLTAEERKANALAAAKQLRRMAIGERPGYPWQSADSELRKSLFTDELAPIVVDAVVRLGKKEAQQDLAGVLLASGRPLPIRVAAVEGLVTHIQQFGLNLNKPQVESLIELIKGENDAKLTPKLLVLKGIISPNSNDTGKTILDITTPGKKEPEKKEPEKKDPEEKKDP